VNPTQESFGGVYKNRVMTYPRGKELGGSSMMNAMMYVRGHSKDYDEWEEMGNPGWSFKDVLPFFKKSERFEGDLRNKERFHGTDGRLSVEAPRYRLFPIEKIVLKTLKDLNIATGDINGEQENGGVFEPSQQTTANGRRIGTYNSFVKPILNRAKIKVLTYSVVKKVLMRSNRANGVVLDHMDKTLQYHVRKEVVISAGAIGSPQILILSGVGPKYHLKQLGINLVRDLPVGQNLQDHCLFFQYMEVGHSEPLTLNGQVYANPKNHFEFWSKGRGPLTSNFLSINGMLHTKINKDPIRPDLQFYVAPFNYGIDSETADNFINYNQSVWQEEFGGRQETGFMFLLAVLRPKSRGSVTLATNDVKDAPIIDPQYLTHEDDLRVLIEGAKFIKVLTETKRFKKYKIRRYPPNRLVCGHIATDTDEYYKCHAKNYISSIYHPVGTCAMGPSWNKNAVVDHRDGIHQIVSRFLERFRYMCHLLFSCVFPS
jgi:choline dehydrogenase-like flavoprotein